MDNTSYSVSISEATVPYDDAVVLTIDFMPLEDGDHNGFLTIVSSDVDESEVVISISGSSIAPPIVGISPSSLSSALFTGETETQSLTISNTGGSELTFSVNVVNSNTRWSFPETNYQEGSSVFTVENARDIWRTPEGSSAVSFVQNEPSLTSRPYRNWQLLANDPQDNDSPYDTENIYYEVTDTSLHFKYEYYEPYEDPIENTAAILYINVDDDSETGTTIDGYYPDYSELTGIDILIYSFGDDYFDGVYVYSEDNNNYYVGNFIRIDGLLWSNREPNTNEFSFGVSNEYFEGLVSMPVASISGSFSYPPDAVPNEGMAELAFRPSWLSVAPEAGDILSGESLDLEVTFDAAGLYGGEYEATIEVYSNDPETQQVDIPVLLTVTGAADITVSDEVVDFGTLYTNYGGSREI